MQICAQNKSRESIRWGLEAPFGGAVIHARYDMTAQWLSNFTGYDVQVIPIVSDDDLAKAAANGTLQMLQTGSGVYTCLQAAYGFVPLVNAVEPHAGHNITTIAGVIFARANDTSLQTVQDIRGKVVATGPFLYLSTFQAQWAYLWQQGVDLFSEATAVMIATNPSSAVTDVASGRFPVGMTRAGLPEDMQAAGTLAQGLLKVLEPKTFPDFPYATTTEQFPGNKISISPNMSWTTQQQLLLGFLNIPTEVARVGQFTTWIPALPITQTLTMQHIIGLLDFPLTGCTSLTNAFDAVICPKGYHKINVDDAPKACVAVGISCPVGYTCYCRPCQKDPSPVHYGKLGVAAFSICLVVGTLFILAMGCCSVWLLSASTKLANLKEFSRLGVCGTSSIGEVLFGRYQGTETVLKMFSRQRKHSRLWSPLIARYKIFKTIKNKKHIHLNEPNGRIVTPASFGLYKDQICALLPYFPDGNLYDILHNPTAALTISLLLPFMRDCLMTYQALHAVRKYGMLLTSHEFMLTSDNRLVYIPSPSLYYTSADSFERKYTTNLSPELYGNIRKATPESDSWSAGFLLYEILHSSFFDNPTSALRRTSFASIDLGQCRVPLVDRKYDVDPLYDAIEACWDLQPQKRPSMTSLLQLVNQLINALPHEDKTHLPGHLVAAMQADESMVTGVYQDVAVVLCKYCEKTQYEFLSGTAEHLGLMMVPCQDDYFLVVDNTQSQNQPQQESVAYFDFVRQVQSTNASINFSVHIGDLRGRWFGERYSLLGSTLTLAKLLYDMSEKGEVLVSDVVVNKWETLCRQQPNLCSRAGISVKRRTDGISSPGQAQRSAYLMSIESY